VGPKHVVRQRSECVNEHNSCYCRYLSNRLVLYIYLVSVFSIPALESLRTSVFEEQMLSVVSLSCFTAVSSTRPGMDSTSCILVEDARAIAQDEEAKDMTSSQVPTEGKCMPHQCGVLY
jgi:hypothetical protein